MRRIFLCAIAVAALAFAPALLERAGRALARGADGLVGSDDRAGEMVGQIAPGYRPWREPLWEPGEGAEPWFFGAQAALGGLVLAAGAAWFASARRAGRGDA